MKTISLTEAFNILERSYACSITDPLEPIDSEGYLGEVCTAELKGDDESQFLYISWQTKNGHFNVHFMEGPNRLVKINGDTMFLIDEDGDEIQFILLVPYNMEAVSKK